MNKTDKKQKSKILQMIFLAIKGFIIGIANVIPGVSGGTLALVLGIYEDLIDSISHFISKFKKSISFLIPVLIGIILAFLSMSHVVTYCLDNYLFATVMLFFGAVLGGMPMLTKVIKKEKVTFSRILILILTFAFTIGLLFINKGNANVSLEHITFTNILLWILIGAIASATMVIPGVSGSAFLMTIGYYEPIMNTVKSLTLSDTSKGHAIAVVCIFGVGVVLGIAGISKLIDFLLKKYRISTFWGIIGFVLASALVIIIQNLFFGGISNNLAGTSVIEYILGIALFFGGFFMAYKLGDK
ncbi:MAG: DUF368 domain-containing protein [Clostridia bacterium]|nr:DUF368 domain-containing protein [Clostridia bacterium]